jgi:hypothetical protein
MELIGQEEEFRTGAMLEPARAAILISGRFGPKLGIGCLQILGMVDGHGKRVDKLSALSIAASG